MAKRTAPVQSARNQDYSDREFLANIEDAIGPDGWATTTEIARSCGFSDKGAKSRTLATTVASRLVWMRAGGLLDSTGPDMMVPYTEPGDRDMRWQLTPIGHAIRKGSVTKAVSNAIERMDPGAQIVLMHLLTQRAYIDAEESVAFALRREYQHNIAQRRLVLSMRK